MQNRIVTADRSKMSVIGKIKIGEKKMSSGGKEYPSSIDHFRATGIFAEYFHRQFGEKPDKILIILPSKDAVSQYFELRDTQLYAQSDGLTIKSEKNKAWIETTYPTPEACKAAMEKIAADLNVRGLKWTMNLKITFLIPKLNITMGVWTFETKGRASMVEQITNTIDDVNIVAENKGIPLSFIPFFMTVKMVNHKVFNEPRKFPVVTVTPAFNLYETQINSFQDVLMLIAPEKEKNQLAASLEISESELIKELENQKTTKEVSDFANRNKNLIEKYGLTESVKDYYNNLKIQ